MLDQEEPQWADDAEANEEYERERRRQRRAYEVAQSFRPSAPIDNRDLLAGRTAQIQTVLEVVYELGQHAVIYGERGVGKTSLSKVIARAINSHAIASVYVTCDGADDYSSIWAKVFDEIRFERTSRGAGFAPQEEKLLQSVLEMTGGSYRPNDVRNLLRQISGDSALVIFIDEFDQVADETARGLMADTIKTLSDQAVPATVVLVGVADSVDQLINEHQSVERALHQILMPRLDVAELRLIVTRALSAHGMKIDTAALRRIVNLSQGLPHYTHLIGQYAASSAVSDDRDLVLESDVLAAVTRAIDKSQQSTQNSYLEAVSSSQKNLYPQVVLACALARRDPLGYFSPSDIREPLSKIMRRRVEIPQFVRHLNQLCEDTRGPLLAVKGEPRRYRYRFINPLMQPYVVMKGIADGHVDAEVA